MPPERTGCGLVLTRKVGETIVIGQDIIVTLVSIDGDKIKLGFTAPKTVPIWRQEVVDKKGVSDGR